MRRYLFLSVCIFAVACGEDATGDGLSKFPTADALDPDQVAFPSFDASNSSDNGPIDSAPVGCVNGQPCDDGNGCTVDDTCNNGVCLGTGKVCDDGVACTTDTCSQDACIFTVTPGNCFIDKVCYTDNAANPSNSCERCTSSLAKEAWTVEPNGTSCDDGDPCSEGDICVSGACNGQSSLCPDDGNPCTEEVCEGEGCNSIPIPNGGACDDGDPCTQGDRARPVTAWQVRKGRTRTAMASTMQTVSVVTTVMITPT